MIPFITKECKKCKLEYSFYEISKSATKARKFCNDCNKKKSTEYADKYKKKMLHAKVR